MTHGSFPVYVFYAYWENGKNALQFTEDKYLSYCPTQNIINHFVKSNNQPGKVNPFEIDGWRSLKESFIPTEKGAISFGQKTNLKQIEEYLRAPIVENFDSTKEYLIKELDKYITEIKNFKVDENDRHLQRFLEIEKMMLEDFKLHANNLTKEKIPRISKISKNEFLYSPKLVIEL